MNFAVNNFSFFSLFFKADFVVKFVIIILIVASIYSWAIILEKYKLFKKINASSSIFEEQFWSSKSADSLYKKLEDYNEDPMANVFKAGMDFMIKNKSRSASIQERVLQALSSSIDKEMEICTKAVTDKPSGETAVRARPSMFQAGIAGRAGPNIARAG